MEHVTHIELENFLSFRKAACRLSPFTLVVGANNSGKSNLLEAIVDCPAYTSASGEKLGIRKHHSATVDDQIRICLTRSDGKRMTAYFSGEKPTRAVRVYDSNPEDHWHRGYSFPFYRFNPEIIGAAEEDAEGHPRVRRDGSGVTRLLEALGSGTRAQRGNFARIEQELSKCIPEIEAISLFSPEKGKRAVQVEQRGLPRPVPLSELSEGSRLVLALLTLVNADPPPEMLVFEDIDRAVHPRLFEKLVDFLRNLTRSGRVQIIATCHNPYLIDEFQDEPEAVVIVEKKDGASTLSNMDERINPLLEDGELGRPLGEIWFGGFAGGVPEVRVPLLSPTPEISSRVAETP